MYAIIRIHFDVNDPIPEVTITGKGKYKDSLEFQMFEQYANFTGWDDIDEFLVECEPIVLGYARDGYLYCRLDGSDCVDFWTVKEV